MECSLQKKNQYAVYLKLTQYYKFTMLQLKKELLNKMKLKLKDLENTAYPYCKK